MVWRSQLAFWSMQVGLSVQAMLTCRHFWCNRCTMHGLRYHQFYTSFEGKLCICSHVYSTRYGQAVWGNACVHKSYLLLVHKRCCTFYAQLRHTIVHRYWALLVIILFPSLTTPPLPPSFHPPSPSPQLQIIAQRPGHAPPPSLYLSHTCGTSRTATTPRSG